MFIKIWSVSALKLTCCFVGYLWNSEFAASLQDWPAWLQRQTHATTTICSSCSQAINQPAGQLQSSSHCLFAKQVVTSYFSSRHFSTAVLWNSLESDLWCAPSLASFKSSLKTALSMPPVLHSTVHCQAATPIRTRPWTLYEFVLYYMYCIVTNAGTGRYRILYDNGGNQVLTVIWNRAWLQIISYKYIVKVQPQTRALYL